MFLKFKTVVILYKKKENSNTHIIVLDQRKTQRKYDDIVK